MEENREEKLKEEEKEEPKEKKEQGTGESYFKFEAPPPPASPSTVYGFTPHTLTPTESIPPAGREGAGGMAVTALVLAILSFFCCGAVTSIPALILAIVDRKKRGRFNACSLIALILSIISLAVMLLIVLLYAVMFFIFLMTEGDGGAGGPDLTILLDNIRLYF